MNLPKIIDAKSLDKGYIYRRSKFGKGIHCYWDCKQLHDNTCKSRAIGVIEHLLQKVT